MNSLPIVAVSSCLLGQKVRYDGDDKYTSLIAEELNKYCQLIPVCPEVEIGLGVPRQKIQLTQIGSTIKVLKLNDSKEDVSAALISFAKQFVTQNSFSGLVLQDKSPSCGVNNTKLYSETGQQTGFSSGLFAATVISVLPHVLIAQESQLQNKNDIKTFVNRLEITV